MKLKYLFLTALASSALFAGCTKDGFKDSFDNIKLDNTFLTIGLEGGTVEVNVTSTEDWHFVEDSNWPSTKGWLGEANPMSGSVGTTKVSFTVPASEYGREIEIALSAGPSKQFLRIRQGSLDPVKMTCKDIVEGANVGATYVLENAVVTQLGDYAKYGAFYVNDGTSDKDVQIYGSTDDSKESYPNVEVGDVVDFSGVWSSYGNFEKVEISRHEKSLLKVIETKPAPLEGGEATVRLAYKGSGAYSTISGETPEWLSYASTEYSPGEPTLFEKNPADTVDIIFKATPFDGQMRIATVKFYSARLSDRKKLEKTEVEATVVQADAGVSADKPFTIAQAIGCVDNFGSKTPINCYVKGKVSKIDSQFSSQYGNGTFWISDDGEYHNDKSLDFEAYRINWFGNEKWKDGNGTIKVGDEVIVCGVLTVYKGTYETSNGEAWLCSLNETE